MGTVWPWAMRDWPTIRIRYIAGYDVVPAPIKQAVLLTIQDLFTKGARDPSLVVDTVYGVGSQQFSPVASDILSEAAMKLLMPYWVQV
jgi:hypothetical protein